MNNRRYKQHITVGSNRGASLIEVLIALFVFSIGLQGIASLQYQAVKQSFDAAQRSQVAWTAAEIVNRIRANPGAAEAGSFTQTDFAPTCTTTPAKLCTSAGGNTLDSCTSAQLATFDLWEGICAGGESVTDLKVTIACTDSNTSDTLSCSPNSLFNIQLSWQSKSVADDSANITASFAKQTLTQEFRL